MAVDVITGVRFTEFFILLYAVQISVRVGIFIAMVKKMSILNTKSTTFFIKQQQFHQHLLLR
jgi:hypothetical protein